MSAIDTRGVRRLFQFVVLFALMIVVAVGAEGLLRWALDATPEWEPPIEALAQSMAFVLIGGPLAGLIVWWTLRSQRRDAAERSGFLFTVYVTLLALVALQRVVIAVPEAVSAALQGEFARLELSTALPWVALWLGHWFWAARVLPQGHNTVHVLLGSLIGLVSAAIGFVQLLGNSVETMLRPPLPGPIAAIAPPAALLLVGALIWALYWLSTGVWLPRRTLWLIYVLPIGVGGALVAALAAAATGLWRVAVWFLGDPVSADALQHFHGLWYALGTVVVGVTLWWYHRTVLGQMERTEVRRVYEYLVAGLGLGAAAGGVGTLIVAVIEAATPGVDRGMTSTNTLLAALMLLAVGAPVWWVFWRRAQRAVQAEGAAERHSRTRRVYLVVIFGVAGVATVIAAIQAGEAFFTDAVAGSLGLSTLRLMRYSLGIIVAAVAVFGYHVAVFRADRRVPAAAPSQEDETRGPRSVLLIGGPDGAPAALARLTGARVERWPLRASDGASAWEVEQVALRLADYPGEDVVVTSDEDGPQIFSVRR